MKNRPTKQTLKIDNFGYNIDGVYQADMGKYDEALEYFSKAIEEDPKNFISYFNRASIKMHFGDIEGAMNDFHKSEMLAPKEIPYLQC
jgi:tetratricopeptide (TPR) repeat protein